MIPDYSFSANEGVRRPVPYVENAASVSSIWRIAPTEVVGRETFWREPATFSMESPNGFWRRTIIPALQIAKRRAGAKHASSRYLLQRRGAKRKGVNIADNEDGASKESGEERGGNEQRKA